MAVVPRTNDDEECIGLYDVFSSSGSRYVVDYVDGRCDCPDDRNDRTDSGCKHRRRVSIALDETPLPAPDVDASDYWPWLLDTLHLLTAEYPRLADDGTVADLLDGALEAVRTVDDKPAASTPA
ncbi:hypothetical protein [Halorientalis sp. IM1011]|uniref:hypothetical protein n=1 Tax=Halorientalis sp. IM1011 TaxID=1932360 RepID=UPI000A03D258|nr:hypothetical protein [Halorientalis sp. IM1011]